MSIYKKRRNITTPVSLLLYNNDETTHYGKLKEKNVSDAGDIVWEVYTKQKIIILLLSFSLGNK